MITFSDVTQQFGNGVFALKDVSFHIEPGEFVVVTGPSGSGMTTLMRLLMKECTPTSGDVWYKGESLNVLSRSQVPYHRRKIGVVFQDYRLLPEMNVWENIALPLMITGKSESEIESRVTDLLNLVGLSEKALMFPSQLSGGEAQRVSIARALATGPSLIFADEPTGNLDKEASLEIMKLLQQIHSFGTTVILATHDVTLLEKVEKERHLILEKGELKQDSRPVKIHVTHSEKSPKKTEKLEKIEEIEEKKSEKSHKTEKSPKVSEQKDDSDLLADFIEKDLPKPQKKDTHSSEVAEKVTPEEKVEEDKSVEKKKKGIKLPFWKKKKAADSEKKL